MRSLFSTGAQDSNRLEQLGAALVTIVMSPFEAIVSSSRYPTLPDDCGARPPKATGARLAGYGVWMPRLPTAFLRPRLDTCGQLRSFRRPVHILPLPIVPSPVVKPNPNRQMDVLQDVLHGGLVQVRRFP